MNLYVIMIYRDNNLKNFYVIYNLRYLYFYYYIIYILLSNSFIY